MRGMEVCYHHGGKSLKGAAHPKFKDGLRSKHMPKFLKPAFSEALNDPELLDLSNSIAGQEALIVDLFESLDGGEAPTRLVKLIRKAWAQFWEATGNNDKSAVAKYRGQITGMLKEAVTVVATIDRIARAEETKRRLIETEMKRREKMHEQIVIDEAVLLYRQLVAANRQAILECKDLERDGAVRLLNSIVSRFAEIAGLPDRG